MACSLPKEVKEGFPFSGFPRPAEKRRKPISVERMKLSRLTRTSGKYTVSKSEVCEMISIYSLFE
jgi:hypothetical protein